MKKLLLLTFLIFFLIPITSSETNKTFFPTPTPISYTPVPTLSDIYTLPDTDITIEEATYPTEIPKEFYLFILLLFISLYLKIKSDSPKLIKEIAIITTPLIIRIKNPTNKKIYIFVKTKKIPASVIKITASSKFIMPNAYLEYNITSSEKVNGSILIYRKDAENV